MSLHAIPASERTVSAEIRVRGRVQGVGFRPTVWRLARELGLSGEVRNDANGVLIRATGPKATMSRFVEQLRTEAPPLARIETIDSRAIDHGFTGAFRIARTMAGAPQTEVAPDAAICPDCLREILDPAQRRYQYPFTTCIHCGPRLSIALAIPYDRSATTMAAFPLCEACSTEYSDPHDRRFHAEAIACGRCGPPVRLVRLDGQSIAREALSGRDDIEAASDLLRRGFIVAVKGLGGYQLSCDATNAAAVLRLRRGKLREAKPLALMARDLEIVRRYCQPNQEEERQLVSSAAPIVLMRATGIQKLPAEVAPGLRTLGFMLPTTPLHALLLRSIDEPVVMTSGNLSDEPQLIDDDKALHRLAGVADYALLHDRKIANRIDDSIVRIMGGAARVLRRSRGFAPGTIALPSGFEAAPDLLAMGGELKSTFCLLRNGQAILSQHQGDLENDDTFQDLQNNLARYAALFDHVPAGLVADAHPDYLSSKLARERAREQPLPLIEVQHHHAHVAACLVENDRPLSAPPVLGIVLDGLGWGEDGTIWGGEFLGADYVRTQRLGTFKPVALLGGAQAMREPWRNLYAHLMAEMGWTEFAMNFAELEVFHYLRAKPRAVLDAMLTKAINAPTATSCGRLFDAVAAAIGICRERQGYEGQAASELEAIVDEKVMEHEGDELAYPFTIPNLRGSDIPYIEPLAMWRALLGDLILQTPAPIMAARFHKGLARAISAMAMKLAGGDAATRKYETIALSGGCFQNEILLRETISRLSAIGFKVLTHRNIPANDGGLSLGQVAVGAARLLARGKE